MTYPRSKAARRAGTPEPYNVDDWNTVAAALRTMAAGADTPKFQKRLNTLADRANEWRAHLTPRQAPPPPPEPSPEAIHLRKRQRVIDSMTLPGLPPDLEERAFWQIHGETQSVDLHGPFHRGPDLGVFEGTLSEAIDWAITQPRFYAWGGGGTITRARVVRAP